MVDRSINSRWWNNRKTRSITMTQILKTDYLKVLVLFSLYAVCFYSALKKFAFVDTQSSFKIDPDYSICKKYEGDENKLESCQKIVVTAYAEAELKCKGFVKQYDTCKQAKRARCHTEFNNIEGCMNSIIKPYLEKRKDEIRRLSLDNWVRSIAFLRTFPIKGLNNLIPHRRCPIQKSSYHWQCFVLR